jgi:hypothetical protein
VRGLLDGTFARGGAGAAVSDDAWLRALLDVEGALARAAARVGLVPAEAAVAVSAACADPARLDVATVVAKAADAGNPVPPLVRILQEAVGRRGAVAVHVGANSQDVLDTALVFVARGAVEAIIASLAAAADRRPWSCSPSGGYDYDVYRRQLRGRGITPRIARRGVVHGSCLGQQRLVVERCFAWRRAFMRRTRYEHRGDIHLGLLQLARALICYRPLRVVVT